MKHIKTFESFIEIKESTAKVHQIKGEGWDLTLKNIREDGDDVVADAVLVWKTSPDVLSTFISGENDNDNETIREYAEDAGIISPDEDYSLGFVDDKVTISGKKAIGEFRFWHA